jgi:hypothetical protein
MFNRLIHSLNHRVKREEAEWLSRNPVMRRVADSGLDALLTKLSRRPGIAVFALLLIFAFLCTLSIDSAHTILSQLPWPETLRFMTWPKEHRENLVPLFLALWAIQATISALVYPIILAFVTLLLQRSASSGLVRVYLHHTGAKFAGLSALALVLAMLVQFVFITIRDEWISNRTLAWWCVLAAIWLAINIGLTFRFLMRTLDFLSPEQKFNQTVRYALRIVWPAQVRAALAVVLYQNADKFELLPKLDDEFNNSKNGPILRLHSLFNKNDGSSVVSISLGASKELKDVWFKPLRIAVERWAARASAQLSAKSQINIEGKKERPSMRLPMVPGDICEGQIFLATIQGHTEISSFERRLIKLAFRFRKEGADADEDVAEYLKELIQEARDGLRNMHEGTFRGALRAAIELHVSLLRGSEFINDEKVSDNFSNLTRSRMLSREFHEEWIQLYRPLIDDVVSDLGKNSKFFESVCGIPSRIIYGLDATPALKQRVTIIRLAPHILWQLSTWWKQTVELQGSLVHNMCNPIALRPPQLSLHQNALRQWIGSWETLRDVYCLRDPFPAAAGWEDAHRWVDPCISHLEETAIATADAVFRGDRIAAEWLADSLQKWISSIDSKLRSSVDLRRHHLLTVESFGSAWKVVQDEFFHNIEYNIGVSQDAVAFRAMRNYWIDVRCVLAFVLVTWSRKCECHASLSADILRGLLDGRSWLSGDEGRGDAGLNKSAPWLFKQFIRQQFSGRINETRYSLRLDELVKRLMNLTQGEWISGRIHTSWGNDDLDSVLDGQLFLLLSLSTQEWDPIANLEADLRGWLSDDERIRDIQQYLTSLIERAAKPQFTEYEPTYCCLKSDKGSAVPFDISLKYVSEALTKASSFLRGLRSETLKTAQISDDRLLNYASYASSLAFARETGAFPLPLFANVLYSTDPLKPQRLTLQAMEKGGFTDPEMAQRASNEEKWTASLMKNHVAAIVLFEALNSVKLSESPVDTPKAYWDALQEGVRALSEQNLTPILLLDNPTRPAWVWDWTHEKILGNAGDNDFYERPDGLRFSRISEFEGDHYLGHFNEVAVYSAPLESGSSVLIPRELFNSVKFHRFGNDKYVQTAVEELEDDFAKVDVILEWQMQFDGKPVEGLRLRYSSEAN